MQKPLKKEENTTSKNKWCCCAGHKLHDESDKFVVISGKDLSVLDAKVSLGEMRKSKEAKQIIEDLMIPKELPGWLLDANLLLDRN